MTEKKQRCKAMLVIEQNLKLLGIDEDRQSLSLIPICSEEMLEDIIENLIGIIDIESNENLINLDLDPNADNFKEIATNRFERAVGHRLYRIAKRWKKEINLELSGGLIMTNQIYNAGLSLEGISQDDAHEVREYLVSELQKLKEIIAAKE